MGKYIEVGFSDMWLSEIKTELHEKGKLEGKRMFV